LLGPGQRVSIADGKAKRFAPDKPLAEPRRLGGHRQQREVALPGEDEIRDVGAVDLARADPELRMTLPQQLEQRRDGVEGGDERVRGFAEKMNTMPKYVVSSTLTEPTWENTTVLQGDATAAVRELKSGDGGPLLIGGSGRLVRTLIADGLVDELRLIVHPVVAGEGARLFEGSSDVPLTLIQAKPIDSGIVILDYAPAVS
jgi:dihydrofolate reductase